ncbi:type 1 glutamine amidotransferase domain-containing protein [Kribbella sancticallisti]|uniref:Type 1 glutamine amidotransferase domain-containing protein n=1 Tax=Kribbella sancticallisti TaxID=460087 RepID=A0ABN2E475_9ACTN
MTNTLIVLSGARIWRLNDGTEHPTGFWVEEFAAPHRVFTEAGHTITIATPGGVLPVGDELSLAPAMNNNDEALVADLRGYLDKSQEVLAGAVPLSAVDPADFDIVFIPGGHGPMEDLATDPDIARILAAMVDDPSKVVASVCHGPASFVSATRDGKWLFAGRKLTAFLDEEERQAGFADRAPWLLESRLVQQGARFDAGPVWGSHIVTDGNLITGQNPASAEAAAHAVLGQLAVRR